MLVNESLVNGDVTFKQREQDLIEQEKREAEERQRERNCDYKHWAQLNLEYTKIIRTLNNISPKALNLLTFIIENMDGYNALVCSQTVLAEALDFSLSSVARAIKILKDNNFIKVAKTGTANVYYVNAELVWKSWNTNKRYAEFSARVIISESEQEKQTKTQKMSVTTLKGGKENSAEASAD